MFNIDYNFVNDNFNGIDKVKIVLGSVVTAAALAFFLFSFLQANADCGNMTGDCDSATSNNDIHRHSDNNNGDKQTISSNNDDNNDKSETNPKDNDPCDYHGLNVCDKSKNGCDSDHFDCLTDLDNGNYCTTGMCPGDDKVNNNQNKDSNKRDGNKSPASNSNVKKFIVKIILEGTANAETRLFQMRVFVYGPNILNKPTIDKPGKILDTSTCGSSCYTEWDFTASKVPLGSEIKACVWNQESGHQACGFGKSIIKIWPGDHSYSSAFVSLDGG